MSVSCAMIEISKQFSEKYKVHQGEKMDVPKFAHDDVSQVVCNNCDHVIFKTVSNTAGWVHADGSVWCWTTRATPKNEAE